MDFPLKANPPASGRYVLLVVMAMLLFCNAGCGKGPDAGPPGAREDRTSVSAGKLFRGGSTSGTLSGGGKETGAEADDQEQDGDGEERDLSSDEP